MVEMKHPDKRVSTGAYSAGVLVDGGLYVSGRGPLDLRTGQAVEGGIEDQTRLTLSHIGKVLEAAGCSFENVVKCTWHLSDIRDFDRFNSVDAQFFPGLPPAPTTVQAVLWGGIKVEIDAIARVPAK